MGWFDRLLGRRDDDAPIVIQDGTCVLRRRELAEHLRRPREPNFGADGPRVCARCERAMPELFITTGGPLGDPDVWRECPVAVDGWACLECGVFHFPRKITPDQIMAFERQGVAHGHAGRLAEAEWWFARMVWNWPGYVSGHINFAEATRARLHRPDTAARPLEAAERRRLRDRMREQYEEATEAYEREPVAAFVPPVARAFLRLAELAVEDRAFERACRALDACVALPGVGAADAATARDLRQYLDERRDLFDVAVKALEPYLDLMDRAATPIETPEARKTVAQAVADLEHHYARAPGHWQAAWMIAKGRAALAGGAAASAALDAWAAAWAAHPGEKDIAREYSLALLRLDRVAEAGAVNRAITAVVTNDATLWCNRAVTELLTGDLAEARLCLATSRQLDPADAIAATLERRLADYETGGAPRPTTLHELERR